MVENRPWMTVLAHAVLLLGVALVALPIWIAFVASTHSLDTLVKPPLPLWPGPLMAENWGDILLRGNKMTGGIPLGNAMLNSLISALVIACGKIAISILSAYAIVYFRFAGRMVVFWLIFITLMLPVEVRIVPSFKVVADLGMLNSYAGLTVPLIASATATFLFRQFFMTVPNELLEAARIDGAGPIQFFKDILLPLSRTNIAALFVILFVYGWNQYLWPLLITTEQGFETVVMKISRLSAAANSQPQWHHIMAITVAALLPPAIVIAVMQRLFIKGLVETEK